MKLYGTEELAILALTSGEVDAVPFVELYSYAPTMLKSGDITVGIDAETSYYSLLYLDHREEPNNIKEFRHAISMAIDRQEIINFGLFGYGSIPRMCPFIPAVIASENVDWPGLDMTDEERITAANAMLDGISLMSDMPTTPPEGWTRTYDGNPLEIEMHVVNRPSDIQMAEIIQENMAAIGIKINIKLIGFGPMMGMLFGGGWDNYSWATASHGASGSTLDGLAQEYGSDPYNVWRDSCSIGWGDLGDGTYSSPSAEAVQDTLKAVRRASDPTELAALIEQSQVDFAEELPVIPLYQGNLVYAYRNDKFTDWNPLDEYDGLGGSGHLLSTPNILSLKPI